MTQDISFPSISDPCESNPCGEVCLSLSATKFYCTDKSKKPCYFEGKRYEHGESNDRLRCMDGNIEFLKVSCSLADGTVVKHGSNYQMDDGIARKCDDGVMKPEKCEFNSFNPFAPDFLAARK